MKYSANSNLLNNSFLTPKPMSGLPIILLAALIPLIVGAIYYNPKVFGNAWMKNSGKTEAELSKGNMVVIFALTYLLGIFIGGGLMPMTNHQYGVLQLMVMHPDFEVAGTATYNLYQSVMDQFGTAHRTFGHGALHGVFAAILLALPFIGINALFERRGGKYIFLHLGYWVITLALMGGVICQFF